MSYNFKHFIKARIFPHLIYYLSLPLLYTFFLYLTSALLEISGNKANLGAAIAATYGFLFLATPILIFVLMRFSMLPWIIDPIAAAALPLSLYLCMIVTVYRRCGALWHAVSDVCLSLSDDGGMGYLFLCGMFFFGLICSISIRRMHGDHLPGRIRRYISEFLFG